MRRVLLVVSLAAPLSVACHTITEELPSRPSSIQVGAPGGAPVIIIQVPVPSPVPLAPVPSPTPRPNPGPTATPEPRPTPTPEPRSTPTPDPGAQNRNPVARMACSVYFVECNGEIVPGSHGASSASVGCKVHLDATTKDADGNHTFRTGPRWVFSNPGMIDASTSNAWNPAFTGRGRHRQEMYAEADGVRCRSFGIDIN